MTEDKNPDWTQLWENWQATLFAGAGTEQAQLQAKWGKYLGSTWQKMSNAWKQGAGDLGAAEAVAVEKLVRRGQAWIEFATAMSRMIEFLEEQNPDGSDWREKLSEAIDHVKDLLPHWSDLPILSMLGDNDPEQWGAASEKWLQQFESMSDPWFEIYDVIGTRAREWKHHRHTLNRQIIRCGQTGKVFFEAFDRFNDDTLEHFKEKLIRVGEAGEKIDDVAGLYEVWIHAREEAYLELFNAEDFSRKLADWVNSTSELRNETELLLDEALGSAGLPTRGEVNVAQQQIQQLNRELHRLQKEVHQPIDEEMAQLRGEMAEMRQLLATAKSHKRGESL